MPRCLSSDGGSEGGTSGSSGATASPSSPATEAPKAPEQAPATSEPSPKPVTEDAKPEIPQIEYIEGDKSSEASSNLLDKGSIMRKASEQFGSLTDSLQDGIDGVSNTIQMADMAAHKAGEELSKRPDFVERVENGKKEAEEINDAVVTAAINDMHEGEIEFLKRWLLNIYHAGGVIGTFVKETGRRYEKIGEGEKAGVTLDQIEYLPASSLAAGPPQGPTQTGETTSIDDVDREGESSLLTGSAPTSSIKKDESTDTEEKGDISDSKRRNQPRGCHQKGQESPQQ